MADPIRTEFRPLIAKQNQSILIRYWTGSAGRHTVRRNVVPADLPQLRRARGDRLRVRRRDQSAATADPSFRELNTYNYFRTNTAGVQREWWFHRSGCRAWFYAERDTTTNEVLKTELP